MATIDQQFVEFIVKTLVSHPDDVSVERTIDEKGVLLKLTVNGEDLGRVIGKRGSTAQSIRTLLRALGTKNDARYNLKIVDPEGSTQTAPSESSEGETKDEQTPEAKDGGQSGEPETKTGEGQSSEDEGKVQESDSAEDKVESLADKTRKELAELDDLDL